MGGKSEHEKRSAIIMQEIEARDTLIIDIDGVIRDFQKQLRLLAREEIPGIKIKKPNQWFEWNLAKHFSIGNEIYPYIEKRANILFGESPPIEGSIEAIRCNSDRYRIVLASDQSRDKARFTYIWVGEYDIPADEVRMTANKETIPGIALLDDNVENLKAFRATNRLAIAYTRPYNREWDGLRVNTVQEFFDIVSLRRYKYKVLTRGDVHESSKIYSF